MPPTQRTPPRGTASEPIPLDRPKVRLPAAEPLANAPTQLAPSPVSTPAASSLDHGTTLGNYTIFGTVSSPYPYTHDLYWARQNPSGQEVAIQIIDSGTFARSLANGLPDRMQTAEYVDTIAHSTSIGGVRIARIEPYGASGLLVIDVPPGSSSSVAANAVAETAGLFLDAEQTIGLVIHDYRIERLIGGGGMGAVYLARQKTIDKTVAVKVLKPLPGVNLDHQRSRFQAEAQILAQLDHPNIVGINNFSAALPGDRMALIMDFIQGHSLAELATNGQLASSYGTRGVLEIGRQVLHALEYAHDQGIVHRDLKPANLMLAVHGGHAIVKVLDFGIAKLTREGAPMGAHTATGMVVGSPYYMAPEAVGQASDARSDLFSLGATLFELLSGQRLFMTPAGSLSETPRRLRDVGQVASNELEIFLSTLLQRDPTQRFQNAREARDALERLPEFTGRPSKPAPAPAPAPVAPRPSLASTAPPAPYVYPRKPRRSGRFVRSVVRLALLGGVAFGGWKGYQKYQTDPPFRAMVDQTAGTIKAKFRETVGSIRGRSSPPSPPPSPRSPRRSKPPASAPSRPAAPAPAEPAPAPAPAEVPAAPTSEPADAPVSAEPTERSGRNESRAAREVMEAARRAVDTARERGTDVSDAEATLREAQEAMKAKDYETARTLALRVRVLLLPPEETPVAANGVLDEPIIIQLGSQELAPAEYTAHVQPKLASAASGIARRLGLTGRLAVRVTVSPTGNPSVDSTLVNAEGAVDASFNSAQFNAALAAELTPEKLGAKPSGTATVRVSVTIGAGQ